MQHGILELANKCELCVRECEQAAGDIEYDGGGCGRDVCVQCVDCLCALCYTSRIAFCIRMALRNMCGTAFGMHVTSVQGVDNGLELKSCSRSARHMHASVCACIVCWTLRWIMLGCVHCVHRVLCVYAHVALSAPMLAYTRDIPIGMALHGGMACACMHACMHACVC